jgi:putative aldouronate transport system permease protein
MKIKKTKGEKVFTVFNTLFLCAVSLACLYPMIYVALASVSDSNELMRYSGALYRPLGFNLNAYVKVFENPMIIIGYKNTLFVLVVGLVVSMVLSILGAYFLSRQNVYFKTPIMIMILVTMYFSGGIVPTYLTVRSLGLADSLWALILPSAISTYNMIILRTGFASIPRSLDEAATIDGANPFTILWKIYIPLSKATIAVIFLYYAVAKWNNWFAASIYLDTRTKYPLQLVLREILISNDTGSRLGDASMGDLEAIGLSIKYATIIVSTLPILVVYPFIQKYFVKGVMIGSVKG